MSNIRKWVNASGTALRLLAAAVLLALFAFAWFRVEFQRLRVIGQPTSVGDMQRLMEQPFFRGLPVAAGLPVSVTYTPADGMVADAKRLSQLKDGEIDLVSLRLPETIRQEPAFLRVDIPGASMDLASAREAAQGLVGEIDHRLQANWDSRLLGLWPMGPQVLMCLRPVRQFSDLKGVRVRVAGEALAAFFASVGAVPARIPFMDTRQALADRLVDCAVSSLVSARAAGWLDHLAYGLDLPLQYAVNGYVVSNKAWRRLGVDGQNRLRVEVDAHVASLWAFADSRHRAEMGCHATLGACPAGGARRLAMVSPTDVDVVTIRKYAVQLASGSAVAARATDKCADGARRRDRSQADCGHG